MSGTIHDQFVQVFDVATPTTQALMLLVVAHNLTIGARDSYPLASEELTDEQRFSFLRDINELQHRILSHSIALLTGDDRRYPNEVLLGMLEPDVQSNDTVAKWLAWSLRQSLAQGGNIVPDS
jgi:hypothetical protein